MINTPGKISISCMLVLLQLFVAAQGKKAVSDDEAPKVAETKFTEVIGTDSVPASELLKRAVSWIRLENSSYKKSAGVTASNKAECVASFPVKPKSLNPAVDYTGKINMKVVIECKDGKFRYIVSDIRHASKNGRTSGGSIDNRVPECGSMTMDDVVWKKLRGEALRHAAEVVADLKTGMASDVSTAQTDEW